LVCAATGETAAIAAKTAAAIVPENVRRSGILVKPVSIIHPTGLFRAVFLIFRLSEALSAFIRVYPRP
jgi:hypothetical protein